MSEFTELYGSDKKHTLDFFYKNLKEEVPKVVKRRPSVRIQDIETLYTASVLASFAQVSTHSNTGEPTPDNLSRVFDKFVQPSPVPIFRDGELMEMAGAQCLLLAGFCQDQMRDRHNINWYINLGGSFFAVAAETINHRDIKQQKKKRALLKLISDNFPPWTDICLELARTFRDKPYLIKPRPI